MLKFCLIYYCTELFYFPRHQKGTAIRKTTARMRLLKVARCKERLGWLVPQRVEASLLRWIPSRTRTHSRATRAHA
jgi:hypothetical protein